MVSQFGEVLGLFKAVRVGDGAMHDSPAAADTGEAHGFPLCRSITVPASFNSTVTSVPSGMPFVLVYCKSKGKDRSPSTV